MTLLQSARKKDRYENILERSFIKRLLQIMTLKEEIKVQNGMNHILH